MQRSRSCPICHRDNDFTAKFCTSCGAKLQLQVDAKPYSLGSIGRVHETAQVASQSAQARVEIAQRPSIVGSRREISEGRVLSAGPTVIEARELSKAFGSIVAVDKVSFKIMKGELFSFLGPNGAGKTTLLRLLSCVLKPSSGTALVLGHDVRAHSLLIRRKIGVIPQWPSLYMDLNAVENFNFFAKLQGVKERELNAVRREFLDLVQLDGREKKLVGTYSGGMMRRLSIACALAHHPSIVFFDEPTSGLDPQTKRIIWKLMKDLAESGVAVILNTHYMEEAEQLSDRVAIIDHGKVIAIGTTESLKKMARPGGESNMTLEDVFIELTGEHLRE